MISKIHTTKLYLPPNGETNFGEISAEIPNGVGEISLSIQRAGSSNQILGPNGWQSADYWFSITPLEITSQNIGWFRLPSELLKHITYSNYSVFCRRINNNNPSRTILTGGDLVSRPSPNDQLKSVIELPPLPSDFSQKPAESLTALEKISVTNSEGESERVISSINTVSSSDINSEQSYAAAIPKETTSNNAGITNSRSKMPIVLGFIFLTLLILIGLYWANFNKESTKNDGGNSQASGNSSSNETSSTPKLSDPRPVVDVSPQKSDDAKPRAEPNKKNAPKTVSNFPKPIDQTDQTKGNLKTEPVDTTSKSDKAQPAAPEKKSEIPEKVNPESSSVPNINDMVKEALKK
jgi:hypothetical protein